jgi:hypothetical protein
VAFRWLKIIFLRDKVQAPSAFSYTTSCRCWHACASFWTNFGWLYRQGDRLIFTACSVAVVKAHQPKLSSLDLKFSTYNLPTARIFDVLVKALYVSATFRTNTYMLCAFGQCGVLGYPYGTTTSIHANKNGSQHERKATRIFEKMP